MYFKIKKAMTIINLINLLDSTFATSFKHTSRVLYGIDFENSNVLKIVDKLNELNHNVINNINTGKHVGAPITTDDVIIVLNTLQSIINHYKAMNNIDAIPSKTKLHDMVKDIRANETVNVKGLAKEVVQEVFQPVKSDKKLTKKEKFKEEVNKKSDERMLGMMKKRAK